MAWNAASLGSTLVLVAAGLFFVCCVLRLVRLRLDRSGGDDRPAPRPRSSQQRQSATQREVRYLERLVAAERNEESVPFVVSDVVVSTVVARRAAGLVVDVFAQDDAVEGVPDDLASVLDSLLVNAQTHGQGRGVRVDSARFDGFVEVVVRDQGPGIPELERPRLFDPAARPTPESGAGLGLHISRNLMRHHGGDLLLRDTAEGAAFVARVPLQRKPS